MSSEIITIYERSPGNTGVSRAIEMLIICALKKNSSVLYDLLKCFPNGLSDTNDTESVLKIKVQIFLAHFFGVETEVETAEPQKMGTGMTILKRLCCF